MKYSPKLKTAAARINAILKEYDITASVILHTPGFGEFITKVDASYSCAKIDGNELRIKASLQKDFNGDKGAFIKKVGDTVNMLEIMKDIHMDKAVQLTGILIELGKKMDIENMGGGFSSHTTQNN